MMRNSIVSRHAASALFATRSFLFLLVASHAVPSIADEDKGVSSHRVRLVWRTDPSTTATISWDTKAQAARHYVILAARDDDRPKEVDAHLSGRYSDGSGYFHHAWVSNLAPGTEYKLTVHNDKRSSDVYRLRTTSKVDAPATVLCLQVPAAGENLDDHMKSARRTLTGQGSRATAMVVQCGPTRDLTAWRRWLDVYQESLGEQPRLLPIVPVPGAMKRSHYAEMFGLAPDDETFFHVQLGTQLGLIVLDTSMSLAGQQRAWLVKTIKSERRARRWLMASYAAAAYPTVSRPSRVHAHWVRVFEDYHLDFAFESELKGYRRTPAIHRGTADPQGVVYFGLGPQPLESWRIGRRRWYLTPPGVIDRSAGSALLQFGSQEVLLEAVAADGRKIERFRAEPRK